MTVDLCAAIIMCALAPIILALFIIIQCKFIKFDKGSLQAQKDYYWLKVAGSSKRLEEDNCSFGYKFVMSLYGILMLFILGITFGHALKWYDLDFLCDFCTLSNCLVVVGILVSTLVVLGLILENRKDFYLGISANDVLKHSPIPGKLANLYAGTVYMLVGYVFCNIVLPEEYAGAIELAQLWVGSSVCYVLVNLMMIIQQTITLCLSVDRKELAAFHCFRRRIIDIVQLDHSHSVRVESIEKITSYLLRECIKNFEQSKTRMDQLQSVNLYSVSSGQCDQASLKKMKRRADLLVMLMIALIEVVGFLMLTKLANESETCLFWIMLSATIILYICGYLKKTWLLLFNARYYYVFSFCDADFGKKSNKVAKAGDTHIHIFPSAKRFEAVGLIEDLLGFYKMLLYDKRGKKYRYEVIKQVLSIVDKKNANIRNAVLLLLYYFEYEKVYMNLTSKQQDVFANASRIPDEMFVQKVNREVEKKKVINYDLLNKYIEFDTVSSAEYQLADAILSEVYKEPLLKDNTIVPDKLKNYKFEYFFQHICAQRRSSCHDAGVKGTPNEYELPE